LLISADRQQALIPKEEKDTVTTFKLAGILLLSLTMAACAGSPPSRWYQLEGLNGTLWLQTSAEYRILAGQAYQRARMTVEKALTDPGWTAAVEQTGRDVGHLPPAIIVDIDETVLDTSGFQARLILDNQRFDEALWDAWVKTGAAEAVPGALDFLQWAAAGKNITIFYITNRSAATEGDTLKNLRDKGFPLKEGLDVILCQGEYGDLSSDKSARRRWVCERYRVLLLAGDNLGDFIDGAKDRPENRIKTAEAHMPFWAEKWIMLPNPLYGSWEGALYDYDRALTAEEIRQRKLERLRIPRQ